MPVGQVYLLFAVGLFVMGLGYTQVTGYRRFLDLGHQEVTGLYGREHPALFGLPPAK